MNLLPQPLRAAYLDANPDPRGLEAMFEKDVARMMAFKDVSEICAADKHSKIPALVAALIEAFLNE